ncbi:hypothetical protein MTO96_020648 [Rhipicephalus appendiculatus]
MCTCASIPDFFEEVKRQDHDFHAGATPPSAAATPPATAATPSGSPETPLMTVASPATPTTATPLGTPPNIKAYQCSR